MQEDTNSPNMDLKPGLTEKMTREAIILAGGFGTRLQKVIPDVPKPMALVNKLPFLSYLLEELNNHGFTRAILATGYRHEQIESYFGEIYKNIRLSYSVENEPLGTGGAIELASRLIQTDCFFVINGDTLFRVDYTEMEKTFIELNSNLVVALKEMKNFDRYGSVITRGRRIIAFNEKKFCKNGFINGGIYLIRKDWLMNNLPSGIFSFEKDILGKKAGKEEISCYKSEGYFIDIGIPEDYERAKKELRI